MMGAQDKDGEIFNCFSNSEAQTFRGFFLLMNSHFTEFILNFRIRIFFTETVTTYSFAIFRFTLNRFLTSKGSRNIDVVTPYAVAKWWQWKITLCNVKKILGTYVFLLKSWDFPFYIVKASVGQKTSLKATVQ